MDEKATLQRYLAAAREGLISKIDGLSEWDARRPMTRTGTNLLGLVKHVASVQLGYFGEVFGRPADRRLPWFDEGAEAGADMWAAETETRESIVDLHHYSAQHSDATIEALPLEAPGEVPWWPADRRTVTLHRILVHVATETARHAGHADILRELIDGAVGLRPGDGNVPDLDAAAWAAYHDRIEAAARAAAGN